MKNANSFIADELAHKNIYLSKALQQANDIIKILEKENERLKDVLTGLASLNNQRLAFSVGIHNDQFDKIQA